MLTKEGGGPLGFVFTHRSSGCRRAGIESRINWSSGHFVLLLSNQFPAGSHF